MIYLRFEICGLPHTSRPNDERSIADFMFEASDPRECTRQAVDLLRKAGWKAIALQDAQEGFAPNDFTPTDLILRLFGAAETHGFAYDLKEPLSAAGGR